MNIVMLGAGPVGLVTGLGFAKLGHRVACVDIDASKIARLDVGECTVYETDLSELLHEMQEAGRIMFTTDLSLVIGGAEVVMIAVGTPSRAEGDVDLSQIFSAADDIGRRLDHEAVVVVKSTVPIGTNRRVLERVHERMVEQGLGETAPLITIASLPEFLSQGRAVQDFFHPERIVIGVEDEVTRALIDRMHEGIQAPRLSMSLESAELAKYSSNALLATKVSFINEIANIADRTGADVRDVAKAVGLDRRIGPHFLEAGIGYGGSCFPKDVVGLHQLAGTNGYDFKLLSAVIEVNNRQREQFFRRVEMGLGNLRGRRIAVWGLAFKGGTDDVRESIAIDLIQRVFARGAEVIVYDPQAMENARRILPEAIRFAPTAVDAVSGADALLVLTDWPEFRDISFDAVRQGMVEPRIFDGRNLLSDLHLDQQGFFYEGVGLGTPR